MSIINKLLHTGSQKRAKQRRKRQKQLKNLFLREKYSKFHTSVRESRLQLEKRLLRKKKRNQRKT